MFGRALFGMASALLLAICLQAQTANVPQIVNSTNLVTVESVHKNHSGYELTLRNTSPVAVYGVAVAVLAKNGACDLHLMKSNWGSFMDPLHSHEIGPLPLPHSNKNTYGLRIGSCSETGRGLKSDKFAKIIIEAVDFENGAYEGNKAEAALLEAYRFGRESQYVRINKLVESELNEESSGNQDWIGVLLTKAAALPDTPDPQATQSIENRFGSTVNVKCVQEEMQSGSMWAKIFFTNNLKLYSLVSSKKGLPLVSLRTWWNSTKGACDYYLPWCRDGSWQKTCTASQVSPG